MELSPYDLAFVAGGFTIVGALVAVVEAHRLAIHLEAFKCQKSASAKLRAAFAPVLAMIYLARNCEINYRSDDHGFIQQALPSHAAEIEEFRIFIPEKQKAAYQSAWDEYRKQAALDGYDRIAGEWANFAEEGDDMLYGKIIEGNIIAILAFAKV